MAAWGINANGLGRIRGRGDDGQEYVIEHFKSGGVIQYRTGDGEELIRTQTGSGVAYEIVNSPGTIIRPID